MPEATPAAPTTEHIDPVCGMTVDPAGAAGSSEYRGHTYYFCNPGCRERFETAPGDFVSGDGAPKPAAPLAVPGARSYVCPMDPEIRRAEPGSCPKCGMALEPDLSDPSALMKVEYTCPMHPEIVRDEPGACPICGMALEPRVVGFQDEQNPELIDMTRSLLAGALLGAPGVFVDDGRHDRGGVMRFVDMRAVNWIGGVLDTRRFCLAGWPFFVRAWASVVNRSPNMFTLIGMGVGAAYLYSAIGTIAPGVFPDGVRVHGVVETYFDTAVVITALVLVGQVMELRARGRTSSALKQLLGLRRGRAVVRDGQEWTSRSATCMSATSSGSGGRKVPVDGVVVEGHSASTNRWSPASRFPDREGLGRPSDRGTVNATGTCCSRRRRVGAVTVLAQM